ncbi:MAG: dihydrodipicolinate synthase family protein, partial [Solirubrobacteraceae bacterium]
MAFDPLEPGVWQILPTPFGGADHAVDGASLRRVVEHAQRVEVTGVVALGVLGEAASLSSSERTSVLETVVQAAGGLPVVAG